MGNVSFIGTLLWGRKGFFEDVCRCCLCLDRAGWLKCKSVVKMGEIFLKSWGFDLCNHRFLYRCDFLNPFSLGSISRSDSLLSRWRYWFHDLNATTASSI